MKFPLFILLLSLVFYSCGKSNQLPNGVLKMNVMKDVFWDIIKADAITKEYDHRRAINSVTDTLKNYEEFAKLEKAVFELHHISKDEFYKSLDYYKKNTLLMKSLMDSITNNAYRERNNKAPVKVMPAAQL